MRLSRRKRVAFGGALAILVLGIGALSLELAARALGYRPRPHARDHVRQYTVESDDDLVVADAAAGFRYGPGEFIVQYTTGHRFHLHHDLDGSRRTRPPAMVAADSLPQIWLLGDSFTHGWSVDDEETFAWKVQEALPGFTVRNYGVGGYGTLLSWLRFEEMLAAGSRPAVVVLVYASFDDGRNTWTREWSRSLRPTKRELAEGIPRAVFAKESADENGFRVVRDKPRYHPLPLVHHSALSVALENRLDRLEDRLYRRSRAVNEAILRSFHRRCQQDGITFVVAGIADDRSTRRTLRSCSRRGIDTVDISIDLMQEGYRNLPHDRHPSPLAHAAYAAGLLRHLARVLHTEATAPNPR